ncbi:MAG TPA: NAD(P)/FAD-dependent oxidoreductase, partial [Thermoanaerobaculia bacterium]
ADVLSEAGLRVMVVEARRRIGGRIWTVRNASWRFPLELGAEFVHGRAAETFRLANEAGLVIDRLPDVHWLSTGGSLTRIPEFWSQVDAVMRRMKAKGRDRSVAEFLARRKLPPKLRALVVSLVEGYHAAHLDRVSERSLSTAGQEPAGVEDASQFRPVGGYSGIVALLRSRIAGRGVTIRRSTPIAAVRWKRLDVRALPVSGCEIRARRAVVTLPLGVLQAPDGSAGAVRFDPALTEKKGALSRLAMGDVARLVFLFREAFWQTEGFLERRMPRRVSSALRDLGFIHSRDAPVPTWWTAAPAQSPMLVGWAGGPTAEMLLTFDRRRMLSVALESLGELLHVRPRRLADLLQIWRMHDWTADPFSRGAYSYELVGAGRARSTLARPVENTLFFAGEATHEEHSGTVEGALLSGQRAAREILGK